MALTNIAGWNQDENEQTSRQHAGQHVEQQTNRQHVEQNAEQLISK